jgi:hypothetical protein
MFSVENHGSIVLVRPLTEAVDQWLLENCSGDLLWIGNALAVEPRYVESLVAGMVEEGFTQTAAPSHGPRCEQVRRR